MAAVLALAVWSPVGRSSLTGSAWAADKKSTPEDMRARQLFSDGQRAYDVGEFDKALGLYTEAYKLKPLPGFLFNIAQCHRQMGNFKEAGFFYGRFIDNSKPEAPNVELARELLEDAKRREAEKQKADEAKAPVTPPMSDLKDVPPPPPPLTPSDVPPPLTAAPTPPADEPPLYKRGVFWGVVGGAVAVAAGGVVLGVVLSKPAVAPLPPSGTLHDIDGRH